MGSYGTDDIKNLIKVLDYCTKYLKKKLSKEDCQKPNKEGPDQKRLEQEGSSIEGLINSLIKKQMNFG